MSVRPEHQARLKKMIDELNSISSTRAEILLLTNFVEYLLKDIIEEVLESNSARKIARSTVVDILTDKKMIENEIASDIKKIFEIRDFYAHNVEIDIADKKTDELIPNMSIVKNELDTRPEWESDRGKKILLISNSILHKLFTELYRVMWENAKKSQ